MLRLTWRNLLARKVRLLMSTPAIVLGIGFLAGTVAGCGHRDDAGAVDLTQPGPRPGLLRGPQARQAGGVPRDVESAVGSGREPAPGPERRGRLT